MDDKTIRLLKEKLPFNRDNFTTHEIAKVCLQLFEVFSPADYDVRRLAEELEKENGIRRLSGSASAIHGGLCRHLVIHASGIYGGYP